VHIIFDGAGYHQTEQVKEWSFMLNIELHGLPPYNPSLNAIERLWKVMSEQVRNNRYCAFPKVFREHTPLLQ
jgi:transposase